MEEDYDEDYEEHSEGLILSMGTDGKPIIQKESDFVEILEKDMNLIKGFIKENKESFDKYCKKFKKQGDK